MLSPRFIIIFKCCKFKSVTTPGPCAPSIPCTRSFVLGDADLPRSGMQPDSHGRITVFHTHWISTFRYSVLRSWRSPSTPMACNRRICVYIMCPPDVRVHQCGEAHPLQSRLVSNTKRATRCFNAGVMQSGSAITSLALSGKLVQGLRLNVCPFDRASSHKSMLLKLRSELRKAAKRCHPWTTNQGTWIALERSVLQQLAPKEKGHNMHGPVQSAPPIHTWLQRKGFQTACLKHMTKSNQKIQHKKWNKKQLTH